MAKKKETAKSYQVFVSHATADKWLARTLCEKIEEAGASTFRDDRDIDGGDDIPERIRLAIKRSNELVVLLTPNSVDRHWVLIEIGAAWGRGKSIRIVPILYQVEVDTIPAIIQAKKAIQLNECDRYFAEVKTRVEIHHEQD